MTKTYWKIVEIGSGMCNTPHLTLFTNVFIMKVKYKGPQAQYVLRGFYEVVHSVSPGAYCAALRSVPLHTLHSLLGCGSTVPTRQQGRKSGKGIGLKRQSHWKEVGQIITRTWVIGLAGKRSEVPIHFESDLCLAGDLLCCPVTQINGGHTLRPLKGASHC